MSEPPSDEYPSSAMTDTVLTDSTEADNDPIDRSPEGQTLRFLELQVLPSQHGTISPKTPVTFSSLPPEVRIKIWQYALPRGRHIQLLQEVTSAHRKRRAMRNFGSRFLPVNNPMKRSGRSLPAVTLWINHESRRETLRYYTIIWPKEWSKVPWSPDGDWSSRYATIYQPIILDCTVDTVVVDCRALFNGKFSRTWIEDVQSRIPQGQSLKIQALFFDFFPTTGSVLHAMIFKILNIFKGAKKVAVRWVGARPVTPADRRKRITQEMAWKLALVNMDDLMPLEHNRKLYQLNRIGGNSGKPAW